MSRLTDKYSDGTPFVPNRILQLTNGMSSVIKKLAHYEDLEEEVKKVWGDEASITKLVNSLNKCACSADGYLDFARILTNDDAEKWLRWKALNEADRLIELPCNVGTPVWTIMCGMTGKHPILFKQDFELTMLPHWGTAVFLTKAEAEAKLTEMGGGCE